MHVNIRNNRRRFLLPLTSVCALCVGLANDAVGQDAQDSQSDPVVNVTDYDVVDLAVKDAELAQVLQMLSLQSRKNIIASKNVSGTVTANLYDVTFAEALDAILTVNGYTWEPQGNFIYVYTHEEWTEKQEAMRATVSQIFELEHLSAETAIEMLTPFLSERGRAAAQGEVAQGFQVDTSDGGADSYAYAVKVVVNDFPENVEKIEEILAELDAAPDQVLVEATILQTQLDEANAFGIDFSIIGSMDFSDVMSPLNPIGALISGGNGGFQPSTNQPTGGGQVTVGNTAGPGGLKVGFVSNDISAFMRVLDEVADSTVLARPKIMVLNRQRAEVLVGARIGYLSTTATETTTTQTVEFLDTGVQLVLRPFISKDGTIRMELKPSVSEANLRTVTDSNGSTTTIPDELTNEVTTNVRVRDGQTVVLGGLFREATSVTRRQVPFLGDVPVLGYAFRGQDDTVQRKEIIFLITPTITHDEALWADGEEMLAMTDLVRIGARQGLLPFSQTRLITSHNQAAVNAIDEGDMDLAMHHIQNSLRLNPNQGEIIRLRQEVSGEMEENFEHSLLERVLHNELRHRPEVNAQPIDQPATDPMIGLDEQSFEADVTTAGVGTAADELDTGEFDGDAWSTEIEPEWTTVEAETSAEGGSDWNDADETEWAEDGLSDEHAAGDKEAEAGEWNEFEMTFSTDDESLGLDGAGAEGTPANADAIAEWDGGVDGQSYMDFFNSLEGGSSDSDPGDAGIGQWTAEGSWWAQILTWNWAAGTDGDVAEVPTGADFE